ncbi:MAG: hypothetical protein AB7K68_13465 [Bacteriovoracia bacterium]
MKKSSSTATKPSKKSAVRPSFYLAATSLALGVAGFLLLPGTAETPENFETLLAHGWQLTDSTPCQNLEPGTYFELESESGVAEGFFSLSGQWLISDLPEPPFLCRKISRPTFIQEIR